MTDVSTTGIVRWQDLKLVTQDSDTSCGLAVLAMICGRTIAEIRVSLNGAERCGPREWREYLQMLGHTVTMHEITDWENLWLLIVPSPNVRGATHVVILDCRPCRNQEPAIFLDPRMGDYRKFHWTQADWLEGRCVHAVAYRVDAVLESPEE